MPHPEFSAVLVTTGVALTAAERPRRFCNALCLEPGMSVIPSPARMTQEAKSTKANFEIHPCTVPRFPPSYPPMLMSPRSTESTAMPGLL